MQQIVEITLFSNSTAGRQPQIFSRQSVEITDLPHTELCSVDGIVSRAQHPSTISWIGGTTKHLQEVTDIKILDNRGTVLIEGQLNSHFGVPREVDGLLVFYVLPFA